MQCCAFLFFCSKSNFGLEDKMINFSVSSVCVFVRILLLTVEGRLYYSPWWPHGSLSHGCSQRSSVRVRHKQVQRLLSHANIRSLPLGTASCTCACSPLSLDDTPSRTPGLLVWTSHRSRKDDNRRLRVKMWNLLLIFARLRVSSPRG